MLCVFPSPNYLYSIVLGSQLSMRVDCKFMKDVLNGDETTEIRVSLREVLSDATNRDYRDE